MGKILDKLKGSGIKPGLETITELMRRLGDPQLSYKSVHVAGTNGKGSTASMIAEMLIRAGRKVALYTSPHLHRFNERVVFDREEISDADLDRLEDEVGKYIDGIEPTYFEFTTAMAFKYFAEKKPDIAVIEVGLGGRLDATNLVDTVVSVITPVSMDHPEFLGSTVEEIAFEKAGIIKPGVPVVSSRQPEEAMKLIVNTATQLKSPTSLEGVHFDYDASAYPRFDYRGTGVKLDNLRCGLIGKHQAQNSSVALAAAEVIEKAGVFIGEKAMREGVEKVRWPGRMELIDGDPKIVIDGTHNIGGAKALAAAMRDEFPNVSIHLLTGMQITKDIEGFMGTLAPLLTTVHAAPIREMQCYPTSKIAAVAKANRLKSFEYSSVEEGLKGAMAAAKGGVLLIAGSLYLVGETRELLGASGSGKYA